MAVQHGVPRLKKQGPVQIETDKDLNNSEYRHAESEEVVCRNVVSSRQEKRQRRIAFRCLRYGQQQVEIEGVDNAGCIGKVRPLGWPVAVLGSRKCSIAVGTRLFAYKTQLLQAYPNLYPLVLSSGAVRYKNF